MRKSIFAISFIISLVYVAFILTACTGGKGDESDGSSTDPTEKFAKYDPPITVNFLFHDDGSMPEMPQGVTWDNNVWSDSYFNELGIKIESMGVATSGNYDNRIAMMLSSNSLPDIFYVSNATLKTFALSDAIQDLGPYLDEYITDEARRYLYIDGGASMKSGVVDGVQYAIPQLRPLYEDQVNNICIRTDWLDNLGIPEPETWEDILYIIEAFATRDPNLTGVNDTYGIGIDLEAVDGVIRGVSDLQGFFNAYRTYPGRWIDGPDGNILYGTIQPEIKIPLAVLRDFYRKGYIDPNYEQKDRWEVKKDLLAGRIGLSFMVNWGPVNYMDIFDELEDGIKFFPIPSADGGKTQIYSNNWMVEGSKVVVNKNFQHPEALLKMFSYEIYKALQTGDDFTKLFQATDDGVIPPKFMVATLGLTPDHNIRAQKEIMRIFDNNLQDSDEVQPFIRDSVDRISKILNGDWTDSRAWVNYFALYGENSSTGVLNYHLDNNMVKLNRFAGAPTETMWRRGSILQWEGIGAFNSIITGREPIEFFDTFVENWMQRGGKELIEEVNEWWATEGKDFWENE